MELIKKIKKTYRSSTDHSANKYLMVPIFIFFALLIFALIRSPILISSSPKQGPRWVGGWAGGQEGGGGWVAVADGGGGHTMS